MYSYIFLWHNSYRLSSRGCLMDFMPRLGPVSLMGADIWVTYSSTKVSRSLRYRTADIKNVGKMPRETRFSPKERRKTTEEARFSMKLKRCVANYTYQQRERRIYDKYI